MVMQNSINSTIEQFVLNLSSRVLYGFFVVYFLTLFISVMPPSSAISIE